MKKTFIILISLLFIIFVGIISINIYINKDSFFLGKYVSNHSGTEFIVPNFSFFVRESGMFNVSFVTLNSKKSIEKVKNGYLSSLPEIICFNGQKGYYDKNNRAIIYSYNYNGKRYLFFNKYSISYDIISDEMLKECIME